MNFSKLGWLRNVLRSTGIIKLIKYPDTLKKRRRTEFYNANKPELAEMKLDKASFSMHVKDSLEWVRVQSFYDDKDILHALSKQLKSDDCFWDVGTSLGLYSLYISKQLGKDGRVISYEPELRSNARLKENIQLNNANNIQVVPLALGKEKDSFELALANEASEGNHQIIYKNETTDLQTQTVQVVKGESLTISNELPSPNIMKIDVEGQEESVLNGCDSLIRRAECHTIIIEVHFSVLHSRKDDEAVDRITALLTDAGFNELVWVDASHLAAYKN